MYQAIQYPLFVKMLRTKFKAAIIDEFQDTDPVQWEIFRKLFVDHGHLYLVGDPKQSIYGFRQADIYTYLDARMHVGSDSVASLDINYRSTPALVEALNAIFCMTSQPELICLPRKNMIIPYLPVQSGKKAAKKTFFDGRGSVHFFSFDVSQNENQKVSREEIAEHNFFPFIAQEILQLHRIGHDFNDFAVLVSDRYEEAALTKFLKKYRIPVVPQHSGLLTESPAFSAFQELLKGIHSPHDESAFKTALGGPILAFKECDILAISDYTKWEELLSQFTSLKKTWTEHGFSYFIQELFHRRWLGENLTLAEKLLNQEEGLEFYRDILSVCEMLYEYCSGVQISSKQILDALDDMLLLHDDDPQTPKKRIDPDHQGVNILTIHSSKGLEFEIVFALGVVKRKQKPEGLISALTDQKGSFPPLIPIVEKDDPHFEAYVRELDAEKMRQLYVAFTRAKQRLYVPILLGKALSKNFIGCASPLDLYFAKVGRSNLDLEELYKTIPRESNEVYQFIEKLSKEHDITITLARKFNV